jgi:hypothetical protein
MIKWKTVPCCYIYIRDEFLFGVIKYNLIVYSQKKIFSACIQKFQTTKPCRDLEPEFGRVFELTCDNIHNNKSNHKAMWEHSRIDECINWSRCHLKKVKNCHLSTSHKPSKTLNLPPSSSEQMENLSDVATPTSEMIFFLV